MSPPPVDLGGGAILHRLEMGDLDEIWAAVEAEREGVGHEEGRGSNGFHDLLVYGLLEQERPRP